MSDHLTTLKGLLRSYADGDVVARRVLEDWLEDHDDPRLPDVRAEAIDWNRLAHQLAGRKPPRRNRRGDTWLGGDRDVNYARWLIDCARTGSSVPPNIAEGVRQARLAWLDSLFPEVRLTMG